MWPLLLLLLTAPPATRAQDRPRLKLTGGSNPCHGLLQVSHKGSWGYVGSSSLNLSEQRVACKSTLCGEPRGNESTLLPVDATFWMQHLKCSGSEEHLGLCKFSQWNVQEDKPLITDKIICSDNISVSLEDFSCAGHVRYSKDGGQTQAGFICGDSFDQKEASVLCSSLGCGGVKDIPKWATPVPRSPMISTSCSGIEDQLWQCAPRTDKQCKRPAYVNCQNHKEFRLKGESSNVCSGELEVKVKDSWTPENNWAESYLNSSCNQMFCGNYSRLDRLGNRTLLTCTDDVHVTLPNKCYGTVNVKGSRVNSPVCATGWSDANSALVCREMGCGTKLQSFTVNPTSSSVLDHVSCSEDDSSLWHCKAKHSLQPFSCNKNVYVICSESVEVRLSDGPSRCSGRVELFFEGQWQTARRAGFEAPAMGAVCRHLGCGDLLTGPSKRPRFRLGPHKFLEKTFTCDSAKDLSSCSVSDINSLNNEKLIVDITCKGHTDVFFSGGFCAGEVQLLKNSELHLLSASSLNKSVADAVCAQRRCGSAKPIERISKTSPELKLLTLKSCPANPTSVFDCQLDETEAKSTVDVAQISCTGSKQLNLTEHCWGFVNMCEDGLCGGISDDAWSDENSKLVCKSLKCGANIPVKKTSKSAPTLRYSGLHVHPTQSDIHLSTAVLCNDTDKSCTGDAAYIVCMGAYKPRFDQPKDFCSGNVQLYQEGQFLSVCDDLIKKGPMADFLCAELGCGSFLSKIPHYGPKNNPPYIRLTCPDNSDGFHSCTSSSNVNDCPTSGLRCSDWRQVRLIRGQDGCSGLVFVFSEKVPYAVSAAGWTQAETNRLCLDLNCGNTGTHQSVSRENMIDNAQFWKGSFDCSSAQSPRSLWECESNRSQTGENLQLNVRCSAPPVVNISSGHTRLAVIDGKKVCSSASQDSVSKKLCKELGYEDAVPTVHTARPNPASTYHHVNCERHHESLGQCQRFMAPCSGLLVSLLCTDEVEFNTSGNCGGDLQVRVRGGLWGKVCSKENLPPNIKETLCRDMCEDEDQKDGANNDKSMDLNFGMKCNEDYQHLRYCLSWESRCETPLRVFCKDIPATTPPPPASPVVPAVLGVVLVLVLCVGALLFLRFYLRRRKKSLKELLPLFWRQKQQDFESAASEEYEDVPNPDANRLQMLVSDAADKGSTSSQNYHNVDELTRPLTSGDDPPCPSEDSDGQESYDDIDEIQTKADVHAPPESSEGQQRPLSTEGGGEDQPEGGGPQWGGEGGAEWEGGDGGGGGEGGAEWEAGEDPDLVLGEDDYLVPPGAEP